MRTDFDLAPYYRATIGFDRVFDLLDSVANQTAGGGELAILRDRRDRVAKGERVLVTTLTKRMSG